MSNDFVADYFVNENKYFIPNLTNTPNNKISQVLE